MRRLASLVVFAMFFAATSLTVLSDCSADEAGALKYLEQAKKEVASKEQASKIDTTLRLAEAELTGVDQAKKDPILKEIATLRAGMASAETAAATKELVRSLDRRFEAAQGQLGLRNTGINKELDDLDALLKDPKTETAIGADKVKDYRNKLTGYRAVNTQKMGEEGVAELKRQVEYTESKMTEWLKDLKDGSPASRDGAADSFQKQMDKFQALAKEVPVGNPAVAELLGRMNGMKKQVDAEYGAKMAGEMLVRLKNSWELDSRETTGWEAETTAPKFAELVSMSNAANSRLGAPKTVELLTQANRFIKNVSENEQAKPYLGASPLKEFLIGVETQRNAALQKLGGFAEAILVEAEAATLNADSRNRLDSFGKDDLRLSLEGHPQLAALQARAAAKVATFDQASGATAAEQSKAFDDMKAEAAKNWPTLIAGLKTVDDFDPAKADEFKGKLIRIKTGRNERGWTYGGEGNYDFAVVINGKPVAGRYSQAINDAIADYQKRTGRDSLPPETPYEVIGVYDGTKITLKERKQWEATLEGNSSVKARGEEKVDVEAPLLTILALYTGPVAAAAPVNELQGSVGSSGTGGFMSRLVALVLFLLAALAVLMKADFGPLASAPQLARVRENMHARNQTIAGFLLIFIGLYGLVAGYVMQGLIGHLLLIAGGVYLALGFFEKQSWWKPSISATLIGFAVPIGMMLLGVGVWRFVTTGMLPFI
jgi:hypothetical protein